jgi:GNAT superfamily N-acetyltransferase
MSPEEVALRVERLALADLPGNVALSNSVGWKDVEGEWRVLHGVGDVRGVKHDGRLVAQGVLGDYGSAATLAKMVVAQEWQRRGLGARLLDGFLADADARATPVGLCATEQGRPLYQSRGFEVSGELMILTGTPQLGTVAGGAVVVLSDVERAVQIERGFCACDRSRMLRARFEQAKACLRLEAEAGFGMVSAQGAGALVGPIWAETEAGARELAGALFAAAPGPIRVDVPLEQVAFRQWLVSLGFRAQSMRIEMARGAAALPWQVPQRFALATQAWG